MGRHSGLVKNNWFLYLHGVIRNTHFWLHRGRRTWFREHLCWDWEKSLCISQSWKRWQFCLQTLQAKECFFDSATMPHPVNHHAQFEQITLFPGNKMTIPGTGLDCENGILG